MPTDASGTIIAGQICQTQFQYASSTLATETQYCYSSRDIYINFGIEIFIIAMTAAAIALIYRFMSPKKPTVIYGGLPNRK